MPEDNKKSFDPSEIVRGIQQLLVSDKKKIAFLFGAGTSLANRFVGAPYIPAVAEMTQKIESKILEDNQYVEALNEMKIELAGTAHGFNIETLLSNIEDNKYSIFFMKPPSYFISI